MGAAVLHTRDVVLEAVEVAHAAAIMEELTLHGGHVEGVTGEQAPAGALLFREPADLRDLWRKESELRLVQGALNIHK